ncbi:MAG TPA: hypothetical protein VMR70_09935, partial [Flavisolibacter sp.]|nr:hypothetical protein [Flavisolibacter sp.]
MKVTSLMNKRRFSFGRVFWVTLAIYMFFMFVGLLAMYVSPAMNKTPNWEKILSIYYLVSQAFSILFFTLFYYVTLNMFYRLFAGKHKTMQFVQPSVIGLLILGAYYTLSFTLFTNPKFKISVGDTRQEEELTLGMMVFSFVMASIFILGFSLLLAYLTYLR